MRRAASRPFLGGGRAPSVTASQRAKGVVVGWAKRSVPTLGVPVGTARRRAFAHPTCVIPVGSVPKKTVRTDDEIPFRRRAHPGRAGTCVRGYLLRHGGSVGVRAGSGQGHHPQSGVDQLRLALRRRLVRSAVERRPRPDQAGPRLSVCGQCRGQWPAGDSAPRQRQGPGAQAVGRQADARVERRSHQRQAGGRVRRPGALLSGRRTGATALSGRAHVFHPESEAGMDDLAARPHGPARLSDRQAFGKREAVVVRRIHRPLRERRIGGRHHRAVHQEQLHRQSAHAAHREGARGRALQAVRGGQCA